MNLLIKLLKWFAKSILVLLGILPLIRCSSGYKDEGGKTYFNGKEITDRKFKVLNEVFAKNDSMVYYNDILIDGADPFSFQALDKQYAKDKNFVYFCDEFREGQNYYLTKKSKIQKIEIADVASFEVLSEAYARDHHRGYYRGNAFDLNDPASLEVLDVRFVKDQYNVYFEQNPVKNAIPSKFQIINHHYAEDGEKVFYFGYRSDLYNGIHILTQHTDRFVLLQYPYSKHHSAVYFYYFKLSEADPFSFEVLGNFYAKDKNRVYFENKEILGADPLSFQLISFESDNNDLIQFAKDHQKVFWKDKIIQKATANSFKVLGLDYSTDGNRVYFEDKMLQNANPKTFSVQRHGHGDFDAEDSENQYFKGKLR
ncbi:MAG: DKNYY domain-containing protein [Saprospiraceae bacterium]|nr:DKNYY domain-containing protein [Saprospiraceae bacterium]